MSITISSFAVLSPFFFNIPLFYHIGWYDWTIFYSRAGTIMVFHSSSMSLSIIKVMEIMKINWHNGRKSIFLECCSVLQRILFFERNTTYYMLRESEQGNEPLYSKAL
jgi:hypothetical protein